MILANCHALERDLHAALEHAEEAHAIASGHGYVGDWLMLMNRQRESVREALEGRILPADMISGPPLQHPGHRERLASLPWVQDG